MNQQVLVAGGKVGVMGKRWNNPDFLAELAEAGGTPELVKFWRSPVFGEKFSDVPAFLLPRFTEMAAEGPGRAHWAPHLLRAGPLPPGAGLRRPAR